MKIKACGGCGFYFNDNHLHKRGDGKKYCASCRIKIEKEPFSKSISQKDIDRIIEALLKVPPPPKKNKKSKTKNKLSSKKS